MTERPWLKSYPRTIRWDERFEAKPLYSVFDDTARERPDAPYLDFFDKTYSYREASDLIARLTKGLQDLGVIRGTKVGLFLPNCPQYVIGYYAILKAGGIVVNYSPLYSVPELLHQVEDSETDFMITLDLEALYPKIKEVFDKSRLKKLIVGSFAGSLPFPKNWLFRLFKAKAISKVPRHNDMICLGQLLENNDGSYRPVEIDPAEDVAVLQYTGGTTGVPKGAMLTHANIYINAKQILAWDQSIEPGNVRMLGALPLFHVFAMTVVLNVTTMSAGTIFLMPKFELEGALKLIAKKKIAQMPGVPTMYNAILNHPKLSKYDLSSLQGCFSGGAPLPVKVKKRFEELVKNVKVIEGYGLTESSPVAAANPTFGVNKPGSIGLPIPGTDIIVADRENPRKILARGETGEICIAGPQVMKGYWNRPAETASTIIDGRLRTGDIGYMDDDGYTFIIDRDKDMILVGGFNAFPRQIEEAIYGHPAVKEVTVIGIPHDYLGEVPKAFVVLKNKDENIDEEKLKDFLKSRLGKHEQPHEIEFRETLPKTMIGKLSKKELVAEEKAKREQNN